MQEKREACPTCGRTDVLDAMAAMDDVEETEAMVGMCEKAIESGPPSPSMMAMLQSLRKRLRVLNSP